MKAESAIVTIRRVDETRTRSTVQRPTGWRRFEIQAERVNSDNLTRDVGLTTLDPWKASICDRARQTGAQLAITFRETGYFDKDLVSVEFVTKAQVSA